MGSGSASKRSGSATLVRSSPNHQFYLGHFINLFDQISARYNKTAHLLYKHIRMYIVHTYSHLILVLTNVQCIYCTSVLYILYQYTVCTSIQYCTVYSVYEEPFYSIRRTEFMDRKAMCRMVNSTDTLLEKFWRISLYVTDDAIAELCR